MPKQSRESIIAELDGRQIAYSEDMSYSELAELLKKAQEADKPKPKPEELIDYTGIRCGLSTIQDLHRRITILERKINGQDE